MTRDQEWTVHRGPNSVAVLLGPDLPSTEEVRLRLYGGDDSDGDAVTIAKANLMAAAVNSYVRLAARLNCDPLRLAEADALGLLWDELAERENMHEHSRRINRLAEQCRQTEEQACD